MKFFLLAICSLTIFGCVSTSQIVRNTHERTLHPDSARIYILRPSIVGTASSMKVYDNNNYVGKTGVRSYLCWDLSVGEHVLKSSSGNVDFFKVDAKAGKTYYLRQKPELDIVSYGSSLEVLEEKEGKAIVAKLKPPKVKYTE